jgi:trk system potassium uptake protein TrkH
MNPFQQWVGLPSDPRRSLPNTQRKPIPPALRLVLGLATLVCIGTILLMLPISGANGALSWNQALFTATSALSVTGLTVITPVNDLSLFGQIVLLLLIQLGGVGFMVTAVVVLRLLGRRLSLTDRLTLTDSLGLLAPGAIVQLTRRVLATVLTIEGAGALLLYLHWRNDERLTESQAAFFALFHAVSAFCNAGFDLFNGTPGYDGGIPRDSISLILIGILLFVGGLGIPVVADLLAYRREHHVSLHTRITLLVVVFLIASGTVGIFLAEGRTVGVLDGKPLHEQIWLSFFQAVASRSSGIVGIAAFESLTPASQVLIMTLMFVGSPPASMGGGITTGTFAVLTISLWSFVRGLPATQFGGRTLATGTVRKAAAVLTISLFVVLLATWLILITHPQATLDQAAFEVISAFATCGLSLGFTAEMNLFGQLITVAMMFWGRLGALTIVIALAQQQGRPHSLVYPEEQILIG